LVNISIYREAYSKNLVA